jgi:hypothetical protein
MLGTVFVIGRVRGMVFGVFALAIGVGCAPSIDSAAKADIDARVAGLRPPTATIPAPETFLPMPLAPGQWIQQRMVDDKGQPSFVTYKVLSAEDDAFWIETVRETYTGRVVSQMLVSFGDRKDPAQVEIRAIKNKDSKGRLSEVPQPMIAMMQSLFRKALTMMVVHWEGQPQEAASVPAGQFASCYRVRSDAEWAGFHAVSDSWWHPAVPISGMVRSLGVDKPFTIELVAYGLTGAVSEF